MKRALATVILFALAACGGGGGGVSSVTNAPGGVQPPPAQAPPPAAFADTTGRVGLFQEFDRLMTPAQIQADAPRYDAVWGASQPQVWNGAHHGMLLSQYFIPQEDRSELSGHDLAWWQNNHPDWILYACDANNNPTHDLAYWDGVDRPDVPLDFHNPDVIDYQVKQLNGANAIAHGLNALAIDQIVFVDAMVGGNPNFGQTIKRGEYACGVWQNGSFVRRYSGVNDPAWTNDMVAFVKTARQLVTSDAALAPYRLKIIVNHPLSSLSNANEQALLANVDGIVDERGYGDYGHYATAADARLFKQTTDYLIYAQQHGLATFVIDYFADAALTQRQSEYAVATYFMANEGRAYLYATPSTGGGEHNYSEYAAQLGPPCGSYYGGPSIYYRKFAQGLVVVNAGSLPAAAEAASLPAGHSYRDIDGRAVTNPLSVGSNAGYVLLTSTNGCS